MKIDPQLHHVAKKITPDSLEKVIEVFELLGCKVAYRPEHKTWAMIKQGDLAFRIQLIEVREKPTEGKQRTSSHLAFLSEHPSEIIDQVEKWANQNQINFAKGAWNDLALWFDLPDLLVDWVFEVMHTDVTKK
jgi:hypothetical protein